MTNKHVHIELTILQLAKLRREVHSNLQLSPGQRRRAIKKALSLPGNGGPVDLYYDRRFVATL